LLGNAEQNGALRPEGLAPLFAIAKTMANNGVRRRRTVLLLIGHLRKNRSERIDHPA
jgi:hypothetical protein